MRGFTLIELLVVVAVIGILAAIGTTSFMGLRERQALSQGAEEVRTFLLRARARTLAAENDSVFGLHLASSAITVFRGVTYDAGATDNETHTLDPIVTISAYALAGGGANVVFDKRTGATSDSGTITLSLVSDVTETATVTISTTGLIE
jgi:prepilin-type N-terminal cleavage/methylation domain-containing protein